MVALHIARIGEIESRFSSNQKRQIMQQWGAFATTSSRFNESL